MSDLGAGLWPPNRLQLGVVATVAASGGLVAHSAGGSYVAILVAAGLGVLVGVALTAYLTWIFPTPDEDRRRRF